MQVSAKLSEAPISAQKCRLVANMVRGKNVAAAVEAMTFCTKKAAVMIKKLIESAIANAEHNHGADIDELRVSEIFVNEGATIKRFRARAKGRGNRILKRCCHITVVLSDS